MNRIELKTVLQETEKGREGQLTLFALLNLGVLESLVSGTMSAIDVVTLFFHADNCLFVHQHLHHRGADSIMSHGVQLADLFDVLPAKEAQREFQREMAFMRTQCKMILEKEQWLELQPV